MSGPEIEFDAPFPMSGQKRPNAITSPTKGDDVVAEAKSPKKRGPHVGDRAARQLALAYYVERLVESDKIEDYAEAARVLGVTSARMAQIMTLVNLAPTLQVQSLLAGSVKSERAIRSVTRHLSWVSQMCVRTEEGSGNRGR